MDGIHTLYRDRENGGVKFLIRIVLQPFLSIKCSIWYTINSAYISHNLYIKFFQYNKEQRVKLLELVKNLRVDIDY